MNQCAMRDRIALQSDNAQEAVTLRRLKKALAGEAADVLAFYTLDTPEYRGPEDRSEGEFGEKALVVSWGNLDA